MTTREAQVALAAYGCLLLLVLLSAAGILYLNDGRFIYTLDDPYIHLAMSEGIAAGNYGVNGDEPAAASSSIIFPFLLAWAAPYDFHEYLPLALNLAALAASVFIIRRFLSECGLDTSPAVRIYATVFTASIAVAMNLVGLAFMGMENSLQVALEILVLLGLVRALSRGRIDWWLMPALIAAPMLRYESALIVVLALIALSANGLWRPAVVAGSAVLGAMAAFAIFLTSKGLSPFPNSVLAHSHLVSNAVAGTDAGAILATAAVQVAIKALHIKGLLLLIAAVGTAWSALRIELLGLPKSDRWVAAVASGMCTIYLIAGQIGPTGRHETTVFTLVILILVYLMRQKIVHELERRSYLRPSLLSVGILAAVGSNFMHGNFIVPVASNNIYEQQFQMHRLVTEYINGPVAANDIGWISYRNDAHVLDLWGLASTDALRERRAGYTPESLQRLTDKADLELIMVYDRWFQDLPVRTWQPVARLHTSRPAIYAADRVVSFYVPKGADTAALRSKLQDFAASLPRGARLDLL